MRLVLLAALVSSLCGCGGGQVADEGGSTTDAGPPSNADTAPSGDPGPVASGPLTYNPCPLAQRIGGFEVTLAEAYTGVNGQVANGVVPGNVPDVVAEAGGCTLFQGRALFCDPACVPGETCGDDGLCVPYPENQSVGTVTIDGLKTPLVMEAKWGNHYTNPGSLEHPGYDEGADLQLMAAGGEMESFTLRGVGVSPLVFGGKTVTVTGEDDVTLAWTPSSEEAAVRVRLVLNINNHGTTSAWIACDAQDTGTFSIPAGLLSQLYGIGVSGFPSLEAERRTVDAAHISAGCVEFEVVAPASVPVEVGGVVSCTGDSQCPPGQSCGVDLQCH